MHVLVSQASGSDAEFSSFKKEGLELCCVPLAVLFGFHYVHFAI